VLGHRGLDPSPKLSDVDPELWWRRAEAGDYRALTLETMYPGYLLGCGEDLARAMALRLDLVVDVSHLFIQRAQGVLPPDVERRLLDYDRVTEIHVSANDGSRDQHRPLASDSFGLAWAHERARAGTPIVLEAYLHRLDADDRRHQVALARGVRMNLSPEEAARRREALLNLFEKEMLYMFKAYPALRCIGFYVAQYHDDEANDAVHYQFVFSVLPVPDMLAADLANTGDGLDHVNHAGAIAAFAAYCKEGGDRQGRFSDVYTPYAYFRRGPSGLSIEIVGVPLRPWLDGVRGGWDVERFR